MVVSTLCISVEWYKPTWPVSASLSPHLSHCQHSSSSDVRSRGSGTRVYFYPGSWILNCYIVHLNIWYWWTRVTLQLYSVMRRGSSMRRRCCFSGGWRDSCSLWSQSLVSSSTVSGEWPEFLVNKFWPDDWISLYYQEKVSVWKENIFQQIIY